MGRSIALLKAGLTMAQEEDSSLAFSSGQRVGTASGALASRDQVSVPRGLLSPEQIRSSDPAGSIVFLAASDLKH